MYFKNVGFNSDVSFKSRVEIHVSESILILCTFIKTGIHLDLGLQIKPNVAVLTNFCFQTEMYVKLCILHLPLYLHFIFLYF